MKKVLAALVALILIVSPAEAVDKAPAGVGHGVSSVNLWWIAAGVCAAGGPIIATLRLKRELMAREALMAMLTCGLFTGK